MYLWDGSSVSSFENDNNFLAVFCRAEKPHHLAEWVLDSLERANWLMHWWRVSQPQVSLVFLLCCLWSTATSSNHAPIQTDGVGKVKNLSQLQIPAFLLAIIYLQSSIRLFHTYTVNVCMCVYMYMLIPHHPSLVRHSSASFPLQVWLLHIGLRPAPLTLTCPPCRDWGWEDKVVHGRVVLENVKRCDDLCASVSLSKGVHSAAVITSVCCCHNTCSASAHNCQLYSLL